LDNVDCLVIIFAAVAALGFWAARWRPGDLERLQEWGLAGRRFGTITSWFLLGGDVYTAYTFIAVPGLVFAAGLGFFAVPYTIIVYPIVFLVLPKFWTWPGIVAMSPLPILYANVLIAACWRCW